MFGFKGICDIIEFFVGVRKITSRIVSVNRHQFDLKFVVVKSCEEIARYGRLDALIRPILSEEKKIKKIFLFLP